MSATNYALRPSSDLDAFLFATIGDDDKGTSVSVLSGLVRLNLDPWEKAQELAQLPRGEAQRKLSSLIAALGGMSASRGQPGPIAERLVSLLPKPGRPIGGPRSSILHTSGPSLVTARRLLYGAVALIAVFLLVQTLWSTLSPSPPAFAAPHAAASTAPSIPR